jgi:hypothetical protein
VDRPFLPKPRRIERSIDWMSDEERVNTVAAYRDRVPQAVIGNSIYVYRTRD